MDVSAQRTSEWVQPCRKRFDNSAPITGLQKLTRSGVCDRRPDEVAALDLGCDEIKPTTGQRYRTMEILGSAREPIMPAVIQAQYFKRRVTSRRLYAMLGCQPTKPVGLFIAFKQWMETRQQSLETPLRPRLRVFRTRYGIKGMQACKRTCRLPFKRPHDSLRHNEVEGKDLRTTLLSDDTQPRSRELLQNLCVYGKVSCYFVAWKTPTRRFIPRVRTLDSTRSWDGCLRECPSVACLWVQCANG